MALPTQKGLAELHTELFELKMRNLEDKLFFREKEIEGKTPEEIERIKDRWAIADAADTISEAISSRPHYEQPKFLGIF